jgi:hypothetical protein
MCLWTSMRTLAPLGSAAVLTGITAGAGDLTLSRVRSTVRLR